MNGPIVLLPGVLRGPEGEYNCEVLVRNAKATDGPAYSDGFVLNAPGSLSDGEYIVTFDHHSMRMTKVRGLWLPSTEIVRNSDAKQVR